jgi:hypothetical protein
MLRPQLAGIVSALQIPQTVECRHNC